ncbi:ATP-binding cassette domain-containing protein [Rhizobium sp.]
MISTLSATPMIETVGLTRRFGGLTALNNVNLKIEKGEIRCLIGPNGAGKSTLFKCLTHQVVPTSGDVLFEGRSIAGLPAFKIAKLGMAIKNQIPSVYLDLEVRENLAIAGMSRGLAGHALTEAIEGALDAVAFDRNRAAMKVSELSHAHRQWCELGMMIMASPTVVLLDEPTAGMTRKEMMRTIEIIRHLNSAATVVVVEHDMEFIRLLAQTVTVLHRGAVFFEGTMQQVEDNDDVRDIYLGRKKDVSHA